MAHDAQEELDRRKYIFNELVRIIASFAKDKNVVTMVTPTSSLRDDVGIDSARLVDIWLDIESRFNISIDDAAMDGVSTLDDLTSVVADLWHGPTASKTEKIM